MTERFVWRLIGKTRTGEMRWTDDTQMSLNVAESLIAKHAVDPDDLARRFADSYRWSRGYGPGAAKLLKRIARGSNWRDVNRAIFPTGSFGNGGGMRAPVVGLFYAARPDELAEAARDSARVTHAHPIGLEGAVLVAFATAKALVSRDPIVVLNAAGARAELDPFKERCEVALAWLQAGNLPTSSEVRGRLGSGMSASESCVTSIYIAVRFLNDPFADMLAFVAACGGDVDTVGAMAGGIWGAANGASQLPAESLAKLEQCERLREVAVELLKARPDDAIVDDAEAKK